jgi:hypothetical protein
MSAPVPQVPEVDYPHLPGEPHNPLMESSLHAKWCTLLIQAVRHTLAGTDALVTGNTPFVPPDGGPHTAPDLMVVPGVGGREFGRYEVGRDGPPPSVCVEIVSPSATRAQLDRRARRWLDSGTAEVYILDPARESIERAAVVAGALIRRDALGTHSAGLALTFGVVDGHLALCCPGGRAVTLAGDPFAWLLDEQHRADAAESRADAAESRADAAQSRAEELAARVAELESRLRDEPR